MPTTTVCDHKFMYVQIEKVENGYTILNQESDEDGTITSIDIESYSEYNETMDVTESFLFCINCDYQFSDYNIDVNWV